MSAPTTGCDGESRESTGDREGQVMFPATAPGTENLGMRRIIHVLHLPKNLVWTHVQHRGPSPWNNFQQVKENSQQSCALEHSPDFTTELILV
jgi:hypothetical protein